MTHRTVADVTRSRRDLLKIGGLGLLGASVDAVWPLQLRAGESKVKPRGTARNVIFYEISGAISHVEGFDFKEIRVGTAFEPCVRLPVGHGQ